jgi:autophagy-related protein 18
MRVLHTIRDTPPNPAGLCTLSYSGDISYLAYPGSSTIGEVQVFDATNLVRIITVFIHLYYLCHLCVISHDIVVVYLKKIVK